MTGFVSETGSQNLKDVKQCEGAHKYLGSWSHVTLELVSLNIVDKSGLPKWACPAAGNHMVMSQPTNIRYWLFAHPYILFNEGGALDTFIGVFY